MSVLGVSDDTIRFDNVSKFYGEVLGVNRVDLLLRPGVTSLVGPNGSGKTTLMNLMTGLLRPTRGGIRVLGEPPTAPERMFRKVGYCTQFDSFPRGASGLGFIRAFLEVAGHSRTEADRMAWDALELVGLEDAAKRKVAAYSKGMRQRVKLAGAIAHGPDVLVLDEPLNGLDPMARAEMMQLFRHQADVGKHVIISSHILHEVDMMSDSVVLMKDGYVVAQGDIRDVRDDMDEEHPAGVAIRCDNPGALARRMFEHEHVVSVEVHEDGRGLLIRTRSADRLFLALGEIVLAEGINVSSVAPADDDVQAVYGYLIESAGEDA